jgi:hypothetical protein
VLYQVFENILLLNAADERPAFCGAVKILVIQILANDSRGLKAHFEDG